MIDLGVFFVNPVLVGNIISLIGSFVMIAIGFLKKKNQILLAQCAQFGIMGAGQAVLGGFSGVVSNIVSILRNLICVKWAFTMPFKVTFIVIQILLTAAIKPVGIIAWLPAIAACLYTWFLDLKNERLLKIVIIITQLFWIVYDFSIHNYTALAFDVFTVISNCIGIIMLKK